MRFNPFRSLPLKAGAVALALLLWVHVATNKIYDYQLNLDLSFVEIPQELILVTDYPENLSVKVRATGKQILALVMDNPGLELPIERTKAGSWERELHEQEVIPSLNNMYQEVEILFPKKIAMRLEKKVEKRVLVRADFNVQAALGFALIGEPQLEPDSVTVSGPASYLYRLKYLTTEQTDFEDIKTNLEEELVLNIPDSLKLNCSDSTVIVRINVEMKMQKTFESVRIISPRNFNSNEFQFIPDSISISLEIPESQVDSFTIKDFQVTFNRPQIMTDSIKAALIYSLPQNVEVIGPVVDSLLIIRKS